VRLTRKGEYALRAMIVLALRHDTGPVRIQEIASAERIPRKFLEQILLELRHAGLVHSKRGAGGGYYLARGPEKITFAEIVRTIDGPLAPLSCVSTHAHESCDHQDTCGLYSVMREVRNAVAGIMESVSLKDACGREAKPVKSGSSGGATKQRGTSARVASATSGASGRQGRRASSRGK
jgi:Rrf2 family cysteine metabolism transcriptional repressor